MYHFDTNILILLLRGKAPALAARIAALPASSRAVSVVVRAELLIGVLKSPAQEARLLQLDDFLREFVVLDLTADCADHYAAIRAELEQQGERISDNDAMIAGTARAHGAVMVTHNLREFERVPGLRVQSW